MTEPPARSDSRPGTREHAERAPDHAVGIGVSRWQKAAGTMGLVVVVWVGGDLIDIATSDGRRPSAPVTQDGQAPAPGAHDPSNVDHGRRP